MPEIEHHLFAYYHYAKCSKKYFNTFSVIVIHYYYIVLFSIFVRVLNITIDHSTETIIADWEWNLLPPNVCNQSIAFIKFITMGTSELILTLK